jgi:hypothetical protein
MAKQHPKNDFDLDVNVDEWGVLAQSPVATVLP